MLFPIWLISLFENSSTEEEIAGYAKLLQVGTVTLKVISWSFLFAAVNIIVTTGYQSIGYGLTSLIMSLLRQVIFILPVAILFGNLWGLDMLWWSYPISDILVMVIFTPYYIFAVKKAFAKRMKNKEIVLDSELNKDFSVVESVTEQLIEQEQIALTAASIMDNEDTEK